MQPHEPHPRPALIRRLSHFSDHRQPLDQKLTEGRLLGSLRTE